MESSESYIVRYCDWTFDCMLFHPDELLQLRAQVANTGTDFIKITPYFGAWRRDKIAQPWHTQVNSPAEEESDEEL